MALTRSNTRMDGTHFNALADVPANLTPETFVEIAGQSFRTVSSGGDRVINSNRLSGVTPFNVLKDFDALNIGSEKFEQGTFVSIQNGSATIQAVDTGGTIINSALQHFIVVMGPSFGAVSLENATELAKYPDGTIGGLAFAPYKCNASKTGTDSATSGLGVDGLEAVSGTVFLEQFGGVPDSTDTVNGTDNSAAFARAIATGMQVIVNPPIGFLFGADTIPLDGKPYLTGPGARQSIHGLTANPTITGGSSGADTREAILIGLHVRNPNGGAAFDCRYRPDMRLIGNSFYADGIGSANRGVGARFQNCERFEGAGNRAGGWPGLEISGDTNGSSFGLWTTTGGSGDPAITGNQYAGRAAIITGTQAYEIFLIMESSRTGVIINSSDGDLDLDDGEGWGSGSTISIYTESVGQPISIGQDFAAHGMTINWYWHNNVALNNVGAPFPSHQNMIIMGRVQALKVNIGRVVGAGNEVPIKILAPVAASGTAARMPVGCQINLNEIESISTTYIDYTDVGLTDKATIAATNRFQVNKYGKGTGVSLQYESPVLTTGVTYGSMQVTKILAMGGRVTSVEIFDGDGGSLNKLRIRIGTSVSLTDVVTATFANVNHLFHDLGVTEGLVRDLSSIRFIADLDPAGTGTTGVGKFRVRIRYVISEL